MDKENGAISKWSRQGSDILTLVRKRWLVPRPTDRAYVVNPPDPPSWPLPEEDSRRKKYARNIGNLQSRAQGYHFTSAHYANVAKRHARSIGAWSVCTGVIERHPVNHHFCVVDYYPDDNSPGCVLDMISDGGWKDAWIIDPWMNISCGFTEYYHVAMLKFCKWSAAEKRVLKGGVAYDPYSIEFLSIFFTAPLRFIVDWEDALQEEAFLRTKAVDRL